MIRKIWRAVPSLKYILCEAAVVSNIFMLCSITRNRAMQLGWQGHSHLYFFTAPQKPQIQHLALAYRFSLLSEISQKRESFRDVQKTERQRITEICLCKYSNGRSGFLLGGVNTWDLRWGQNRLEDGGCPAHCGAQAVPSRELWQHRVVQSPPLQHPKKSSPVVLQEAHIWQCGMLLLEGPGL